MEAASLQSPSIESFSYSWLSDDPSSISSTTVDEEEDQPNSFIEMDPRLPPSKRFIRVSSSSDFGFDFPISESPFGLVHADQLISNGYLVPLFVKDVVKMESNCMPTPSDAKTSSASTWRVRCTCTSLRRCHMVSKRLFRKYLKLLLRPFFCTSNVRVGMNRRSWEVSAATSPRTSVAYSLDDNWRRSCDSDSSIYEAVLHCKRTQGK